MKSTARNQSPARPVTTKLAPLSLGLLSGFALLAIPTHPTHALATEPTHALATDPTYDQFKNVVYAETDGIGLVMDIFTPKGQTNGLGIVDVVSGSWSSSRGKLDDHKRAQVFEILCQRGYIVFALRPGSVSKFTLREMLRHTELGVRWVKNHAEEYEIDPQRLGIMGASAGGHLASLLAVANENSKFHNQLDSASVRAAAVFFPPTDLVEYGGQKVSLDNQSGIAPIVLNAVLGNLPWDADRDTLAEKLEALLVEASPARRVTAKAPPFLIIHGDADYVVPLSQSQKMVQALEEKQIDVELIIKPGGGHPWPTIHEEVKVFADWFDQQLGSKR